MADKPARSSDRFPIYLTAVAALVLSLLALDTRIFGLMNSRWNDQLFRWRGMEKADPRVIVVEMDDQSIKEIGTYPWSRDVYVYLLNGLFNAGAKVVGLDVIFPDPSPDKENDTFFANSVLKNARRVVVPIDKVASPKDPEKLYLRYPFVQLRSSAKHFGFVDQPFQDSDAVVRWTVLFMSPDHDATKWAADPEKMPGLGVALLALYKGVEPETFLKDEKRPNNLFMGRNRIFLNHRGVKNPGTLKAENGIQRIASWKVIKNKLSPEEKARLKDSIVLFGSTARAAFDQFPNPFTEAMPGVEIHATVIDNLLNNREMRESSAWWTVLLIVLFAGLGAWVVSKLDPLIAALAVVGTFAMWVIGGYLVFSKTLNLFQFWEPTIALLGPFSVLMIRKTLLEQQSKRHIQSTFGRFVSPDVVKDLAENPDKVKIGAQERDMTVFFLDIAHFTTISEKIGNNIFEFLNVYLSALTHVIEAEQKGTVDKYIGDCVMAFWNAPLDQTDHRLKACLAALRCQEVMEHTNKNHKFPFKLPEIPEARIGLNSGLMKVGFTGSQQKLQYTVIGDEVNLGSRLEGANKFFGSKIMVSDSCYKGAKDHVDARFLGEVRVVGKAVPIGVYELLAEKGKLSPAWQKALPLYNKGLEAFKEGVQLAQKKNTGGSAKAFEHSKDIFGQVLKILPNDAPSKLYYNTSEDYSQIPPPDWDGVFNLTAK